MDDELEYFRLKGLEYGQLTGVNIAVHALNDAFMLMHCGVGCKHKTTSQLSTHDLARNVVDREGWTEVGDAELIAGSSHRIGPYLRSWYQRVEPSLIVVISVTFLDLTGEDVPYVVKEEAQTVPCPVIRVSAPGTGGDLLLGYQNATLAVLRMLDWTREPIHRKGVSILGYYFDRYEGDHAGNLQQLNILVKMLGLELGGVALSGVSIDKLQDLPTMKHQLLFPLMVPKKKRLRRFSKREFTEVPLPMGLRLTARWLHILGAQANHPPQRLALIIDKKESQTLQKLRIAHKRLQGKRVGVVADLSHAVGLVSMLDELMMTVSFVAIRGEALGGKDFFFSQIKDHDIALDEDCTVLENPSLVRLRTEVDELAMFHALDGVIASSTELNVIERMDTLEKDLFLLEFGFPCRRHHLTRPTPYFGYTGLLCFADRLMNAQVDSLQL